MLACSYKEIRMQDELHGNVAYHGVELLVLVSMLFLLAIPNSILTLKEFLYTSKITHGDNSQWADKCTLCRLGMYI